MRVKDKVAIVVGGASGIGRATAQLLAKEGARVVIADINIENANKIADGIKADGGEAVAMKVDMTKEEETIEMVKATLDRYGQIDILANIAGGSMGPFIRDAFVPFAESTKEMWDRIIDINLNGARNCTRAVINHMMERGSGKIVNVSSIAAIDGQPKAVDYAAAKAGIIAFTKSLGLEMAPYGIQVNCVTPGGVASERLQALAKEREDKGQQGLDTKKLAQPEELARVILLLVSDEVSHMIGENIILAGARGQAR